jgi:hypothetical protein
MLFPQGAGTAFLSPQTPTTPTLHPKPCLPGGGLGEDLQPEP